MNKFWYSIKTYPLRAKFKKNTSRSQTLTASLWRTGSRLSSSELFCERSFRPEIQFSGPSSRVMRTFRKFDVYFMRETCIPEQKTTERGEGEFWAIGCIDYVFFFYGVWVKCKWKFGVASIGRRIFLILQKHRRNKHFAIFQKLKNIKIAIFRFFFVNSKTPDIRPFPWNNCNLMFLIFFSFFVKVHFFV